MNPIPDHQPKRAAAQNVSAESDLHIGSQFGNGAIEPLLHGATHERYRDVITEDRRGGNDR